MKKPKFEPTPRAHVLTHDEDVAEMSEAEINDEFNVLFMAHRKVMMRMSANLADNVLEAMEDHRANGFTDEHIGAMYNIPTESVDEVLRDHRVLSRGLHINRLTAEEWQRLYGPSKLLGGLPGVKYRDN